MLCHSPKFPSLLSLPLEFFIYFSRFWFLFFVTFFCVRATKRVRARLLSPYFFHTYIPFPLFFDSYFSRFSFFLFLLRIIFRIFRATKGFVLKAVKHDFVIWLTLTPAQAFRVGFRGFAFFPPHFVATFPILKCAPKGRFFSVSNSPNYQVASSFLVSLFLYILPLLLKRTNHGARFSIVFSSPKYWVADEPAFVQLEIYKKLLASKMFTRVRWPVFAMLCFRASSAKSFAFFLL